MKFSIVTPVYNMEHWISETIESVLSQEGDFEIEYIVVNDHSIDKTESIIKGYLNKIDKGTYPIRCKNVSMKYICRNENNGMYNAINEGFLVATGDIYAWINADDVYEPDAFNMVIKTLTAFHKIAWVKGITSTINERGQPLRRGLCKIYHQDWLAKGVYGQEAYFVEQDSVFWRAALWKKAGKIPTKFKSAGDYWLWLQFSKYALLWSINIPISNFRKREGQLSKDISRYKKEQWEARPKKSWSAWNARLFFSPQSRLTAIFPRLNKFFIWLYPIFFRKIFPIEYIEIKDNNPVKRNASSYVI